VDGQTFETGLLGRLRGVDLINVPQEAIQSIEQVSAATDRPARCNASGPQCYT